MAIPTPSLLDWSQIIQRVFDEPNGLIRTNVVFAPNPGSIEVIIDMATDSIKLGDGTNLFTSTTIGPKTALDVNIINPSAGSAANTPFVANVAAPTAGTEYSYIIPDNTTVLFISSRLGKLQIAFTASQSGTVYKTINRGSNYTVDNLQTSGNTIYFQSSATNDIIEFHGWTL